MRLHTNKEAFNNAILITSNSTNIAPDFIEKDYWISLVLKRLSESKYVDSVVFKGGTSLSKGFKLINRFSEDVDIAVIDVAGISGNQLKTLIRSVEKEIARDLKEIKIDGLTSKGSRFRKSVYEYPTTTNAKAFESISNSIVVEVNSFANPYPYLKIEIQSMIGEHLKKNNQPDLVRKYGLDLFSVNVLDLKQTLIEKLVSLLRFSYADNSLEQLSGKIRHFYDLYYLANNKECSAYLRTEQFKSDFNSILEHDRKAFDEPTGWNKKAVTETPLLTNFDELWNTLKLVYSKELSMLAYAKIPEEKEIAKNFKQLIPKIIE
ncbi:MAG: nucleotidyl transferase AbiEii/AbiGii toxin family protein [Bacteroidetes bacterium]|nr:nucleotidyl transferase AbiEii/AbiGii toxin family protein [Bacteroidota bacterium]